MRRMTTALSIAASLSLLVAVPALAAGDDTGSSATGTPIGTQESDTTTSTDTGAATSAPSAPMDVEAYGTGSGNAYRVETRDAYGTRSREARGDGEYQSGSDIGSDASYAMRASGGDPTEARQLLDEAWSANGGG